MKAAGMILLFTIALNLVPGVLTILFQHEGMDTADIKLEYNSNDADLSKQLNATVSTPQINDNQNFFLRILDYVTLGYATKIQNAFMHYVFGFPYLLQTLGILPEEFASIAYIIVSSIYVISAIFLFTGKEVGEQ